MIHLLLSINPAANRARYYRVAVEPTLIGNICLTRCWGRIGGHERRMAPEVFEDWDAAIGEAAKILRKKLRRGYREKDL